MKIETTLSRRRLLAGVPAVAAAGIPSVATALGGLPIGSDAELLALKPEFDEVFEQWWQQHLVWEAHTNVFEAELERRTGMTRAQSWKLLKTNGAKWEETYHAPMQAIIDEDSDPNRGGIDDEEMNRRTAKRYELIDAILSHYAVTPEGLALQCRAMIMDNFADWPCWRTASFVASVAAFAGAELPAPAEELFAVRNEDDEDEA
jgi:hypothetical protein